MEPVTLFALIGLLGIGSQWLAWRFQLPAIVLMLAAGLAAGPLTGVIEPKIAFGDLFEPVIAVAVAVILFEGGLTLNFKSLRDAGPAVQRLVFVGAPLGWAMSTLAVHYGAGLSWETSLVFGGIMIVTGPTVIMPLLRQARLSARTANVLRWESIINDPIGALAAVLAYEVITALQTTQTLGEAALHLAGGIIVASILGYIGGYAIAWTFRRGKVPEYMKVPVLFGAILVVYAASDAMLHESGLLAVTIMGIFLANAHLPSFDELRRFKEHATVILVSGVFIMLAASLTMEQLTSMNLRTLFFVVIVVFLARPATVLLSLLGTDLKWQEKAMVAWIGPRGVVLVAVSGLFGGQLVALGFEDAAQLTPLAFALVAATVVLHGFSMAPLARILGLTSAAVPGVLLVGGSRWAVNMATALKKADIPVMISDRNWVRLRSAREGSIPVFHGEILSETAEHTIEMNRYGHVIAATDNDAYNALIGTDLGPEFGRSNVFQVGRSGGAEGKQELPITLGGRSLGTGISFEEFARRVADGWSFRVSKITDEYSLDDYLRDNPDTEICASITSENITFFSGQKTPEIKAGTRILAFSDKAERGDGAA